MSDFTMNILRGVGGTIKKSNNYSEKKLSLLLYGLSEKEPDYKTTYK